MHRHQQPVGECAQAGRPSADYTRGCSEVQRQADHVRQAETVENRITVLLCCDHLSSQRGPLRKHHQRQPGPPPTVDPLLHHHHSAALKENTKTAHATTDKNSYKTTRPPTDNTRTTHQRQTDYINDRRRIPQDGYNALVAIDLGEPYPIR